MDLPSKLAVMHQVGELNGSIDRLKEKLLVFVLCCVFLKTKKSLCQRAEKRQNTARSRVSPLGVENQRLLAVETLPMGSGKETECSKACHF